jgi:hypothetical protein
MSSSIETFKVEVEVEVENTQNNIFQTPIRQIIRSNATPETPVKKRPSDQITGVINEQTGGHQRRRLMFDNE